jgi:hypothetical protein
MIGRRGDATSSALRVRAARLFERLSPRRAENWRRLRQLTDEVGAEVEAWSYDALDREGEELPPITRRAHGCEHRWQVERWRRDANGDLHVCVDCWSPLPTLFGVKPSYVFIKQRDGGVRY